MIDDFYILFLFLVQLANEEDIEDIVKYLEGFVTT